MLLLMQNSIYKIEYLLFLSWDWEAWCLTVWGLGGVVFDCLGTGRRGVWLSLGGGGIPPERNTAWNKGRKCFHCLGAPNNLIRPWNYPEEGIQFLLWPVRSLVAEPAPDKS